MPQPNPPLSCPWIQNYPDEIPAEIDIQPYSSLVSRFDHCVDQFGDRPAFSNFKVTLTYREINVLEQAFAVAMQDLGLVKGDRIALMMPNILQYPICLLGALRAGLVVVNTNPLYTGRELRHQLLDSGARTIVVLENFAHVVAAVAPEIPGLTVIVTAMGDLLGAIKGRIVTTVVRWQGKVPQWKIRDAYKLSKLLAKGRNQVAASVLISPSDLAFLQYTGGTTGASKGAMLSHGNMVANIEQATIWLKSRVVPGQEIMITALPLYHIFALMANMFTYMGYGALNVLITNPRDTTAFINQIRDYRFTAITGVNTLFNALLNHPHFGDVDFSALRLSLGGGMAVQRTVAERWQKVTGCTLIEAYGLTETSPAVCINPMNLGSFNGCVGLPLPNTEVCVRGDDRTELLSGVAGELWVRGPQVMRGYWQQTEATAGCIDGDAWFATGDIATIDEQGFVRIVDRKKDMIIVSGFNVYPSEIEEVIASHPQVLEVGVIGVLAADGISEEVKAVVVKRDADLSTPSLQQWCREYLTGYKIPKQVQFVSELPKTNVGKVLRRALRTL